MLMQQNENARHFGGELHRENPTQVRDIFLLINYLLQGWKLKISPEHQISSHLLTPLFLYPTRS